MNSSVHGLQDLLWALDKVALAKKTKDGFTAVVPVLPKPTKPKKTQEEMKAIRVTEMDLWKKWKDSGHKPEHLDPLIVSLKPVIEMGIRRYRGQVEIPNAAIDFQHKQLLVKALKNYDPGKGTQLKTYVTLNLKQADRYVKANQNFARIPENISSKIGKFRSAKVALTEQLGHEPDAHALAHETGFSLREVKRLETNVRKTLIEQGGGDKDVFSESKITDNARFEEVKLLIYPELTPKEKIVYEHLFGMYGKQQLKSTGAIGRKLGWDDSKVSKVKKDIRAKMQKYIPEWTT